MMSVFDARDRRRRATECSLICACLVALAPGVVAAFPAPSSVPATNAHLEAGFLDATLYVNVTGESGCQGSVDPTGTTDSWCALQRALDDAYAYGLTLYLPSGTYLISDALTEAQVYDSSCAKNVSDYGGKSGMDAAPGIVGAKSPSRPTIVLVDHASGFDDPSTPKNVVAFRNDGDDGWKGAAVCGFRMVMRSFEVVLGDNPGAVGVANPSAQYSTIEDVSVVATGGYAGLRGAATTNAMTNINVTGGQYGVIADMCCGIAYVGLTLKGQTVASLMNNTFGTVTVSGFELAPAAGASAVSIGSGNVPQTNYLSLIDGNITMADGATQPVVANPHQKSVFLQNVTVKTPTPLITNGSLSPTTIGSGWQMVTDYSYGEPNPSTFGDDPSSITYTLIDGTVGNVTRLSVEAVSGPQANPIGLHAWTSVPYFDDAGVKNVFDTGAKGDGITDDSDAIQAALDSSTSVFLPRGDYLLGKPITVHAGSRLFGVPGQLSRLYPEWSKTDFDHAIVSDAAADGDAYLGDIAILLPKGAAMSNIGGIHWRIGRNAIIRQLGIGNLYESDDTDTKARQVVEIEGGGGRWYGLAVDGSYRSSNADLRAVLVADTTQPTTFYGMNLEHHRGDFQMEVASSSNVRVIGTKTETDAFIAFRNSSNVMITGLTANSHGALDFVVYDNCDEALGSNIALFSGENDDARGGLVTEIYDGVTSSTPQYDACSYFSRGAFDSAPFADVGDSGSGGSSVCGDGACGADETCASCANDCACDDPGSVLACAMTDEIDIADVASWATMPATTLTASSLASGACDDDDDCSAVFHTAWDAQNLYVLVEISDDVITGTSSALYDNDGVELYLDGGDERADAFDANDGQMTVDWRGQQGGVRDAAMTFHSTVTATAHGYAIAYVISWDVLGFTPGDGSTVGFDISINDNDSDDTSRDAQLLWFGSSAGWNTPATWGELTLASAPCGAATSGSDDAGDAASDGASRSVGGCSAGGAPDIGALLLFVVACRYWRRRHEASP